MASLKPRKLPVQARSAATIEALHAATIQVLVREGLRRCTTTRVAERAGMSVGSLYQYYPNRDALLSTLLETHLTGIADAVEAACHNHCGRPVREMAEGLVEAFLAAKLRNPEESRALYAIADTRRGPELLTRLRNRNVAAVSLMLASAPDAGFDDPELIATIVLSAMTGTVRILLEGQGPEGLTSKLKGELSRLIASYLGTERDVVIPG